MRLIVLISLLAATAVAGEAVYAPGVADRKAKADLAVSPNYVATTNLLAEAQQANNAAKLQAVLVKMLRSTVAVEAAKAKEEKAAKENAKEKAKEKAAVKEATTK